MICGNAYYLDGKLRCKVKDDIIFGDRCPLVYYCTITGRFENTNDCLTCIYRKRGDEECEETNGKN